MIFYKYSLHALPKDQRKDCKYIMQLFDEYCEPNCNFVFERLKFFAVYCSVSDTIKAFVTDLKKLASMCEFDYQTHSLSRDRIELGIKNKALQECPLEKSDFN